MIVIGLISGTSVDGIDAALVKIAGSEVHLKVELLAGATYPYPTALREKILAVCAGGSLSMAEFAELDDAIARSFARAARAIQTNAPPAELIGSHGQTVYHRPPQSIADLKFEISDPSQTSNLKSQMGYSLQLGRGEVIAALTGIPTISNFRVADIAAGGQGAPLVSKVDACVLSHPQESRCVQNIGGIGNVTYLPVRCSANWEWDIRGWDTGPGNTLLDLAVQHLSKGTKTYDLDGAWAASGTCCHELVRQWLTHEFFQEPPPKSTGRELFGWDYFQKCLADAEAHALNAADLLATLTELTAASIALSYRTFLPRSPDRVLLCGGGSRNLYLKQRLQIQLESIPVLTTDEIGLSADYKEAIAFAVLAYWRRSGVTGNLPSVTGALEAVLLGDIHPIAETLHASIESCASAVSD